MIDTTARRDRRTSTRLDQLVNQTGTGHRPIATPAGRPWLGPDDPPSLPEPEQWPLTESEHPAPDADPPSADPPATGNAAASPPGGPPPRARPVTGSRSIGVLADSEASTNSPTSSGQAVNVGWAPAVLPGSETWWRRTAGRLFERWLPDRTSTPSRWRLPVLAAGAALLGVAVAAAVTLPGTDETPEVPPALPAAASVSEVRNTVVSAAPEDGGSIVVSVVGRVATPGLVTLRGGARVADALEAAGGSAPGVQLGGLNLARRLADGEQIYVGVPTPPGAEPPAGVSDTGQPGAARVDLNSASLSILDTLPGVGPVTAQRILDWRTRHGRFASVEQLREIEGIGPTRYSRLKDLVVAG